MFFKRFDVGIKLAKYGVKAAHGECFNRKCTLKDNGCFYNLQ